MIDIIIPEAEHFDEQTMQFTYSKEQKLTLEHSLIAISKWESKFEKPFLSSEKTTEEVLDYIKCMTITQNVNPDTYLRLSAKNLEDIQKYIEAPMTATTFKKIEKRGGKKEIITAELIYYWMIAFNIPFECQKWHLNKLLTLIEVCARKNEPPKKMSRKEISAQHRAINKINRERFHTKG
jgi:hypothetical protein